MSEDEKEEDGDDENEEDDDVIPINVFFIRLLYDKQPTLNNSSLLKQLQTIDESIESVGDDETLMYINRNHRMTEVENQPGCPVSVCVASSIDEEELGDAIRQTWDWPEAETIVPECAHAVLINDINGHLLKPKDRLENIQKTLAAVLQLYPPRAIHWPTSQRIVDPQMVSDGLANQEFDSIFNGAVNVRFFNVEESPDEMVMDTLGLAFFQLADLQCHFSGLEPGEVANCLFDLASYIFENGAVIEAGHTVTGSDGKEWECTLADSLVDPLREVIDLSTGK